eukprot:1097242-Rhodomonas_salina.1
MFPGSGITGGVRVHVGSMGSMEPADDGEDGLVGRKDFSDPKLTRPVGRGLEQHHRVPVRQSAGFSDVLLRTKRQTEEANEETSMKRQRRDTTEEAHRERTSASSELPTQPRLPGTAPRYISTGLRVGYA